MEKRLPVFVLEEAVLLPGAVVRLETDAKGTELARNLAHEDDKRVVVALSTDEGELGVYPIASLARVEGVAADGGVIVAVTGRVRVLEMDDQEPVPSARVEELVDDHVSGTEVEALALEARRIARDILALLPAVPPQVARGLDQIRHPGALADVLAHHVPAAAAEKQKVLSTLDPVRAAAARGRPLARRREVLKAARDIEGAVQEQVSKAEREHILRRRLAAIQEELGEGPESDADDLAKKSRRRSCPRACAAGGQGNGAALQAARAVAGAAGGAHLAASGSPTCPGRRHHARTTSTWPAPREMLDADHHGLEKVKQRILEYLAVRKLKPRHEGADPLLRRPAGRGQDLARPDHRRALGRKFVRVVAGRRARRGGDPRAPAHLRRLAARAASSRRCSRPGTRQPGVHARRDRQARRATSAAIPRRRCSRCSTPSRTTPSPTTTSTCRSTCRRCSSSPPPTTLDTDPPRRCATAWRSSRSPATRARRRSAIAEAYLIPSSSRSTGSRPDAVELHRTRRSSEHHRRLHARGRRAQAGARDRRGRAARSRVEIARRARPTSRVVDAPRR